MVLSRALFGGLLLIVSTTGAIALTVPPETEPYLDCWGMMLAVGADAESDGSPETAKEFRRTAVDFYLEANDRLDDAGFSFDERETIFILHEKMMMADGADGAFTRSLDSCAALLETLQ